MSTTADTLRRIAERHGWVGEGDPTGRGSWECPMLDDPHGQLECFLVEALHCALTHREPLIALRAWGQACGYLARVRERLLRGASCATYSRSLMKARNRIESALDRKAWS